MLTDNRPLWATQTFQAVAGSALRPGGTKLTEKILTWLAEKGLLPAHGLALDLGCGTGASLSLLAERGLMALGLDTNTTPNLPQLLAQQVAFVRADIEHPPVRSEIADILLLECVLSLLPQPRDVLRTVATLLKAGGICLLSDLTLKEAARIPTSPTSCAHGARPASAWRDMLSCAGFHILREEHHDRELRELAARLIWYGSASPCVGVRGLGYAVWVCQKPSSSA